MSAIKIGKGLIFSTICVAMLSACSGSPKANGTHEGGAGKMPDLHPIIHTEGTPAKTRFRLPDASDIMDRRIWLEDRYPWLKNPVTEYSISDSTLQDAIAGIMPKGVNLYWGDVDREKVISFDFSSGDLFTMLRSITRVAGTNFDVVSHNGELGIIVTNHETYQTTISAPDVSNQYTGINGNMLSALGSMGGGAGGIGGGGMSGGMGGLSGGMGGGLGGGLGGGMGGSMGGGGGSQSSAGLLMVTSSSGMQTFWQDLVGVLNGMASGYCTSPMATVVSQSGTGGSSSMPMSGMGGMQGGMSPGMGMQGGMQPGMSPGMQGGMPNMGVKSQYPLGSGPGAISCGRVRVSPDSGLGYIYAYDKVSNIFRIKQYMDKIKTMLGKQVYLKIDIAEIDLSKQDQYGINWSNVMGKVSGALGNAVSFASPSASLAGLGGTAANTTSGIAGNTSNYALGVVSGASNTAVLQALSTTNQVHLVNQPRIMTISGPSVTINTTKSEPYLQSEMPFSAGGLSSATEIIPQIGFVPVGVSLVLTPTIREKNNSLSLYVAPTLNILEGFDTITAQGVGTFQEPIVDSRSLSSVINVKSGDTVIFGGLISSNLTKERWQIPVLGNWFPALFGGYNNIKKTTELVFLITPVIVNEEDYTAVKRETPRTRELVHAHLDSLFMRQTPQSGLKLEDK